MRATTGNCGSSIPRTGDWRKARNSPSARPAMGQTIWYDPTHKRMLIAGGGALDAWKKGKAPEFRELYAYDPTTETVERLADAPTALYSSHLAFDRKQNVFFVVAVFDKKPAKNKPERVPEESAQPSGMFVYDPMKDVLERSETGQPDSAAQQLVWLDAVVLRRGARLSDREGQRQVLRVSLRREKVNTRKAVRSVARIIVPAVPLRVRSEL